MHADEADKSATFYNECLPMLGDNEDRLGVGAVLAGLEMGEQSGGQMGEAERHIVEAKTQFREGGGGQGLS